MRKLRKDQDGSALLFGAFSLFALAGSAIFVMDAWEAVRFKIQAQGAADAASFSASALQVNAYGMVAALNDTLIWLYRAALAMIAAVVTFGTLTALNAVLPGAFLWAVPLFDQSLTMANAWLPEIYRYAQRIANVQDRIVQGTPPMMQAEALRIARANGAEGAFLSSARMHLVREYNFDRFAGKLTGGIVPAWTIEWLFPRKATGTAAGTYQRLEDYREKGRDAGAGSTVGQAASGGSWQSEMIGGGVGGTAGGIAGGLEDRRLKKKFDRFVGIIQELQDEPLPLPYVLTPRHARASLQAVAWSDSKPLRDRPPAARKVRPWPDGTPGTVWTLANTRPSHPKLEGTDLDRNPENLYVERGWTILWVPVDLRRKDRDDVRQRLEGVSRLLEGWIEH